MGLGSTGYPPQRQSLEQDLALGSEQSSSLAVPLCIPQGAALGTLTGKDRLALDLEI